MEQCFFFQAEDGIRDRNVTGVQTCALPIWHGVGRSRTTPCPRAVALTSLLRRGVRVNSSRGGPPPPARRRRLFLQIGRASCRERVDAADGNGGWVCRVGGSCPSTWWVARAV